MSEVSQGAAPGGQQVETQGTDTKANPQAVQGGGAQMSSDQAGAAIKEAAAEARRKLKIDDQEIDEDEVVKVYKERTGHQRAANKELQEGKAAKRQAEEFVKMMKDKGKLFEAIQKLGHDPRALAEEYLASQLEEELLDPREKELREYKKKLSAYQELERRQKEAEEKQRDEALKAKYSQEYTTQFVEALKTEKIPPTKKVVADMAAYIHRAAKMNFKMTAQEAAKLVREDIETAHRNLFGESDAETLFKLLGEQGVAKIRGYDASRLKKPEDVLKTPPEQGEPRTRSKPSGQRMTPKEWREFNRK